MKNIKDIEAVDRIPAKNLHPQIAEDLLKDLTQRTEPVTAFVYIKYINEITGQALKVESFKDQVIELIDLNEGNDVFGAHVTARGGARQYNYDDSELERLQQQAAEIKEKIKNREKFLQSLKQPMADVKTGEIINPAELIKAGIVINVKFK